MGCGFKKFRVNCDGSINPEWGDSSVLSDNNLDKIVTPKPLQTFEDSSPNDDAQANEDMQASKDSRGREALPEYEKELTKGSYVEDNDNLARNTNDTPYVNPDENAESIDIIRPGCCGDIHFHY